MQALSSKAAIATAVQAKAQQQRSARAAVVVRASAEVRGTRCEAMAGAAGRAAAPPARAPAYPNLTLGCRGWGRPAGPPPAPGSSGDPLKPIARRPAPAPQGVDRRAALGLLAAAAAVSTAQPSEAAYGDAARVFAGNITNKSGARGRWARSRSRMAAAAFPAPADARPSPPQASSPTPARASQC